MQNLWSFDLSALGDLKELSRNNRANADYPIEWKECVTYGKKPGKISHHQTAIVGKIMYLIGGSMAGLNYTQDKMYRLDL